MIDKKPYVDINDTLRHIKIQVMDSMEYAREVCPRFTDPEQLFYWLKENTTYENDPKGVELLQTFQTMMENNFHGITGAGDCDCFTIATIACMAANGWKRGIHINLVGRSKLYPVHIYTDIDWNGKRKVLDLTNPRYNQERDNYRYTQRLACNFVKNL